MPTARLWTEHGMNIVGDGAITTTSPMADVSTYAIGSNAQRICVHTYYGDANCRIVHCVVHLATCVWLHASCRLGWGRSGPSIAEGLECDPTPAMHRPMHRAPQANKSIRGPRTSQARVHTYVSRQLEGTATRSGTKAM